MGNVIGVDDARIRGPVAARMRALWDEEKRGYPKLDEDEALALLGEACAKGDLARAKAAVGGGASVHYGGFHFQTGAPGTDPKRNVYTAVHVAARNDHPELVRFLVVGAEADADARDTDKRWGYTPCIDACDSDKRARALQALVEVNADVNRAATGSIYKGRTPCIMAAYWGNPACLRALGAAPTLDVNAVAAEGDEKGQTALDVALDKNQKEAAAVLRDELGAKRAADLTEDDKRKSRDIARGVFAAPAAADSAAAASAAAPVQMTENAVEQTNGGDDESDVAVVVVDGNDAAGSGDAAAAMPSARGPAAASQHRKKKGKKKKHRRKKKHKVAPALSAVPESAAGSKRLERRESRRKLLALAMSRQKLSTR